VFFPPFPLIRGGFKPLFIFSSFLPLTWLLPLVWQP
jgi:hypothetical protein